jgi:hypothetical protein
MVEMVENEVIGGGGSHYEATFRGCKFLEYNPVDYVKCVFIGCTFPNNPNIGKDIFFDKLNEYSGCTYNINLVIKKLISTTSGLGNCVNSFNVVLNKNTKNQHQQIVDVGKTKRLPSELAVV